MARKTERLYASFPLQGADSESAALSLKGAIVELEKEGKHQGREILYDTLDVAIERTVSDVRTLMDAGPNLSSAYTNIQVSAEAVLL
jgi:hypothetical protein